MRICIVTRFTRLVHIYILLLVGVCCGSENTHIQSIALHSNPEALSEGLSPVIFIPGLGGNKLQAKLDKTTAPHSWCSKKTNYYDIWLNLFEMLPNVIDCWVDNMRLQYSNVTRKTTNTPGVEIKLPEWGTTEAIEWIDSTPIFDHLDSGAYFYHIAQALTNRGYVRGQTIFGAAYDFRKAPNENDDWFERLVHLTEHAYQINNNTAVTFVVHSMGGKMILYFLQQMPQTWKDQYVKRVISLSAPWGGSVQAIVAVSVGDTLDSKMLNNNKMKQVQETFPSIVWVMPTKYFWKPTEVVAVIGGMNYTLENIDQYYKDIGLPNVIEMQKDQVDYMNFTAPGVEMHCLYSSHVDTAERMNFGESYNLNPSITMGNGDGVVNIRSLIGCDYWKNTPAQGDYEIHQKEFPGIDHLSIVGKPGPINYILSKLTGYQDYPRSNELNDMNMKTVKIPLF